MKRQAIPRCAGVLQRRPSWLLLSALGCAAVLARPLPAAAAEPDLQALRLSLAHYDLTQGGSGTLQTLRALGEASEHSSGRSRDEARFLRVAVASDLVILSQLDGDNDLAAGVAAALGVAPAALQGQLSSELNELARGQFRAPALEALETLARLRAPALAPWQEPQSVGSAKRDLLYLRAAVARLDQDDAVSGLASLSVDPCAAKPACAAPFAAFDARGRRAVAALAEAGRALARLRAAATTGDPLVSALGSRLDALEVELRLAALHPMPRLDAAASADASGTSAAGTPDVVLFVGATGIRWGFTPHARLGADGAIALSALAQPMLPATAPLPLPHKLPPFWLVPLPGVVQPLGAALAREPSLRVGLAAEAAGDGDLLARALVSVRRVGCQQITLLAAGEQGLTSGMPLSLLSKLEADQTPPAALRVSLRPGRSEARLSGREVALQDLALEPQAQRVASADVSFVPQMEPAGLAAALFQVAPAAGSTRLLLPASALDQCTAFKRELLALRGAPSGR